MDQNQSSEEPIVYFPDPPIYKQRWVKIVFFIALSPLLAVAFLWIKDQPLFQPKPLTPPAATSSATLKTIKESELPIAFDILKNPMVYEWRGSVEGTLVAKDNKSITLEKDGKSITIKVDLNQNYTGTKFFKTKPSKDPRSNFVSLQDIPIGTRLRGDFFIFPNQKNEKVGSSFMVIEP